MPNVLLWIAIALLVLWVLGWGLFEAASIAVHVLLVAALVMLALWVFRRATGGRTPV